MADQDRFKVILPPNNMKIVRTRVDDGPSFHAIEHCVCTPDFGDLIDNALSFSVFIPLCRISENVSWKKHHGTHSEQRMNIIVTSLRRASEHSVVIGGHLKHECELPICRDRILDVPSLSILYCLKSGDGRLARRGLMDISRESYMNIVKICQRNNGYL